VQGQLQPRRDTDRPQLRLRILLSYWYYKDTDLDALFAKYFTPPYPQVFADSGAFSAFTQGVAITPAEYAAWVQRWGHLFTVYCNLDVIGSTEGTAANQAALEQEHGLAPLPVFHVGEPWAVLESLIDRYPYIALGGMVPHLRYTQRLMPWLVGCFKRAAGRAVFHGLGATNWTILKAFPWYSVDSSSWGQGFRYGQVPLFDAAHGRFVEAQLGDPKTCYTHAGLFRQLGFDPADFADRARNDRAKICAISALSYMHAEAWLRKRHGAIYIPRRDAPPGVQVHLADANPARYGDAMAGGVGVQVHLADTSNGINWRDADAGVKIHLAGSRDDGKDLSLADGGLKIHLADARGHTGSDLAAAEAGLRLHLVDSPHSPARDQGHAQQGIQIHLAEHSLDRGGRR
jgi:hypothetical protein